MPERIDPSKFQADRNGNLILEKDVPFSKSILWDLQRAAYTKFGIQAWSEKGVPFYLTGNPYTARQYVNVVVAYLFDCLNLNAKTPIKPSAPIMIFDLGAGSGRFAYLFLKQLLSVLNDIGLEQLKICYVITDFVQENLDFCASHPQMQSFIQKKMLDFAIYDNNKNQDTLRLIHSQQQFSVPLENPAVVIANYFFDTIPQELYKVQDGKLLTGNVTLTIPDREPKPANGEIDPAWINDLSASYSYSLIENEMPYQNKLIDRILNDYRTLFEGFQFLFPIGAFQAIDDFAKLTDNRMLLLAGDQGVCTANQIKEWGDPHLSLHGSFSIAVNYHAIQRYFKYADGDAFVTRQPDPLFVVLTGILGGNANDFPQTQLAFKNHFDAFEPSDYWKIACAFEQENFTPALEHLLTLLKLGNWDPINFNAFYGAIRRQIPTATIPIKRQLANVIDAIWENCYPIAPEEGAFIMNLGVLLFEMEYYTKALVYFQRAQALSGNNPTLQKNIEACKRRIQTL